MLLLLVVLDVETSRAQDHAFYPGTYNNQNPLITYSGSWTLANNTAVGMRSSTSTTAQYSAFEFSFIGTGVEFLTRTGAGLGTVDLCVDLSCTTHNLDGANTAVILSKTGYAQAIHSFRARYNGTTNGFFLYYLTVIGDSFPLSHGVSVSNFPAVQSVSVTNVPAVVVTNVPSVSITNIPSVSVTNFPDTQEVKVVDDIIQTTQALTPGYYDDLYPSIEKDAYPYSTICATGYSGGCASRWNGEGTIRFSVLADTITIFINLPPVEEEFVICIPDFSCGETTVGGSLTTSRSPLEIDLGSYGQHSVTILFEDDTHDFILDGIFVHEPAVDTWTVGDTPPTSVQFHRSMSAGDLATAILLGAIATILLAMFGFNIWKQRDE